MKKRLYILFLSLFSVSGVTSAQEVFNKVMESAQHILNEPTSTFTNTQIAKFKVDEPLPGIQYARQLRAELLKATRI